MNLWHDIPLGDGAPEEFNAIIEIPRGSNNKYEVDKETGLIKLDRANYSAAAYPFDDKRWDDVNDLADVNKHSLREFQHFFETYKALKGKPAPVEIRGIDDKAKALAAIERSMKLYKEKFGK